MKFLFFSTESESLAAFPIMKILVPIEESFNQKYSAARYTKNLNNITIVPICMPASMLADGFGKERKYVTLKKRYADLRLQINHEHFTNSDRNEQIKCCLNNILESISYIQRKDKTFNGIRFAEDIKLEFKNVLDYSFE